MKLLIFSDNHRDRLSVKKMIDETVPVERIFSLGDSEMSENELSDLDIIGVKGNYPFEPKFPNDLLFDFDGIKVFFTHGHKYHVKLGISTLMQKAESVEANIVCFGHTHQSYLRDLNNIIYLNPGSLSKPKYGFHASYALIEITESKINIKLINLETNKTFKELTKKR